MVVHVQRFTIDAVHALDRAATIYSIALLQMVVLPEINSCSIFMAAFINGLHCGIGVKLMCMIILTLLTT